MGKRSPHLVPYANVDEAIKTANRQTASEIVKTLYVYGYTLDPPSNENMESKCYFSLQLFEFCGSFLYHLHRNVSPQ